MTPYNRGLVEGIIKAIDQFLAGERAIGDVQAWLQSAIPLFDNEFESPISVVRAAEADLEEIQFARLLDEQRPAAIFRLDELRSELATALGVDE